MGFNIFQKMLVGPFGVLFLRRARAAGRPVFAWTVDDERWMEWCIRNGLDGVITDNPARFLEVCRRHGGSATVPPAVVPQPLPPTAEKAPPGRTEVTRPLRAVQLYLELFGIHIIVVFFSAFFFVRHGLGKSRFRKDIAHGQVL